MPNSHAPSLSTMPSKVSPATDHAPMISHATKFDSSHLYIPRTAYPRGRPASHQHSTGHMRSIASTPYLAPYNPIIFREPLEFITCEMVHDRIYLLLRNNLSEWWTKTHAALHHLTRRMADDIIRRGQHGAFGPSGLASRTQTFVCIGHENLHHYMCLAVQPSFGHIQVILRGNLCEREGKDPVFDHAIMALCKEGFDERAAQVYKDICTAAQSCNPCLSSDGLDPESWKWITRIKASYSPRRAF